MKKLFFISFLILTISLLGCKKKSDNSGSSVVSHWENITLPQSTYQAGWLWAISIGSNLFIGNESNSGQFNQFFTKYDFNTSSFTDLPTNGEICACGYNSILVTDNTSLYYFANEGVKFSPGSQSWSSVNYPYAFQNGEAGCGVLNGRIYYIGGRNFTTTVRYYDISSDSWDSLATKFYYRTNSSAVIGFNNKLYVLGGNSEGQYKVSVYDPLTDSWSKKADCPYKTYDYAVLFQNLIIVRGDENLYCYDPINDKWKSTYALPSAINDVIPFVYNSNLYIVGINYDTYKIVLYKFKDSISA